MKRDKEFVRDILRKMRDGDFAISDQYTLGVVDRGDKDARIKLNAHLLMLHDDGYIHIMKIHDHPQTGKFQDWSFELIRMTWSGHDLLEELEDAGATLK